MGEGGGRAERSCAVRKPFRQFWGWMSAKALLSLCLPVHKVSLKSGCCAITRLTRASDGASPAQDSTGAAFRERGSFPAAGCAWAQPSTGQLLADKVLYQQCLSLFELLQQTIRWFLCFDGALSLFPRGSQVSVGKLAVGS